MLYTYLDENFKPIVQNVFFLFDKATNQITSYINVITSNQSEVLRYVKSTYSQVSVAVEGTWMRLDFVKTRQVSIDDLKMQMVGLYEFLKNFDLLEQTTQIRTKLYSDAITLMKQELEREQIVKDGKKTD